MSTSNQGFSFYNAQVAFSCILKAFGIGNHDRVLLPGYINPFIPQTVHHTGAIPEYADIDDQSFNSLLGHYEEAYKRIETSGTAKALAAVLIQHSYGKANPDSDRIIAWAREKGLVVVEHFIHDGLVVPATNSIEPAGDAAFYACCTKGVVLIGNSKYVNIMATIEKVAPKPTLRESLSIAAIHGIKHLLRKSYHARLVQYLVKLRQFINLNGSVLRAEPSPREFFRGVGPIQHHIIQYYANNSAELVNHKQKLAAYYSELLKAHGLPCYDYSDKQELTVYPVRVKNKQSCLELAAKLGLELTPGMDYPFDCLTGDADAQSLPNAMAAAQEVVCLPLHKYVTRSYADQIVNVLDSIPAENTSQTGVPLQNRYGIHLTAMFEHLSDRTVKSLRKIPWFGFKI